MSPHHKNENITGGHTINCFKAILERARAFPLKFEEISMQRESI